MARVLPAAFQAWRAGRTSSKSGVLRWPLAKAVVQRWPGQPVSRSAFGSMVDAKQASMGGGGAMKRCDKG